MNDDLKSRSQMKRLATTDPYVLVHEIERLRADNQKLVEILNEIAFQGTSRPLECGAEDDGDGWYKRIAYGLIGKAARALAEIEGRKG